MDPTARVTEVVLDPAPLEKATKHNHDGYVDPLCHDTIQCTETRDYHSNLNYYTLFLNNSNVFLVATINYG